MAARADLQKWIIEALKAKNGSASVVEISEHVWRQHEKDLRASGDLFYTWQYDIRWAANILRANSTLLAAEESPRGVWELS